MIMEVVKAMRNSMLVWSLAAFVCSFGYALLIPSFLRVSHLKLCIKAVRLSAAVAPPEALFYGFQLSGEDVRGFPPGVGVYSQDDWKAAWRTAPEVDYTTTNIEGSLPSELLGGSLYRAGPARFDRGGSRYEHVLDGDGYVLKFSFPSAEEVAASEDTGVHVRGRFVETAWYKEEEASDELKFRNTFGKYGVETDGSILLYTFIVIMIQNIDINNLMDSSRYSASGRGAWRQSFQYRTKKCSKHECSGANKRAKKMNSSYML